MCKMFIEQKFQFDEITYKEICLESLCQSCALFFAQRLRFWC